MLWRREAYNLVHLQWFPSAPTMGTSNKHDTFHQCCFIVPASVEDHGTTLIQQPRKVSCFPGAMYEDGRTRGLLLGDSGYPCLLYLTPIARMQAFWSVNGYSPYRNRQGMKGPPPPTPSWLYREILWSTFPISLCAILSNIASFSFLELIGQDKCRHETT